MNRITSPLFFITVLFLSSLACQAQDYTGDWKGKLDIGTGLRIVFHIRDTTGGRLVARADSPDQNAYGLPCDSTYTSGGSIHIEMRRLRAAFVGKLLGDSVIDGSFTQGGPFPLRLTRAGQEDNSRPQDPKPPFPYKTEDLVYTGKKTGLSYGATVSIPAGRGPFPAAILVTGSGQQNRDEELMGHRPFAVLADALARKGILVLRVDDRGIGKSTGDFSQSTSADFAGDVSEGLDYLLSRSDVKKSSLGIIGHSEGGMIAPIVCAGRKDITFVVLLAAPGIPINQLMAEQSAAIFRSSGVGDSAVKAYQTFYYALMKELTTPADSATAIKAARTYMNNWAAVTDTAVLSELQLNSPVARLNMFRTLAPVARNPWFRYFFAFDPATYLEKMDMKILALNGEKDIQVLPASNMQGIRHALDKGGNKKYTAKVLPGLNHLFQSCKTCTVNEYSQLTETFSPLALEEITGWLEREIK